MEKRNEQIKNEQIAINIKEKANLIWSVADIIRDTFKAHEYGKVILPLTVLKRLNDTLLPTKNDVIKAYEEYKSFEVKDAFLTEASGYSFYNTSLFTFKNLLDEPEDIEENFKKFMAGFSDNIQDILNNFDFENTLKRIVGKNKAENMLFYILKEFNKPEAYMGLDKVSTDNMGYIFEELVRKFSESYNEEAGAHFTARDIIYTMTDLLVTESDGSKSKEDCMVKSCYDMTMGTSQMLTCLTERIKSLDKNAIVSVFGQEKNPETYAIAKADMIIRGGKPTNMRFGNTLTNDQFDGMTFDYIISNPPFGTTWKTEQEFIVKESALGDLGRFGVGLPKISDGQMLFTLNGIKKLKNTGKMAIIHNGSPLFSGDAGSGPSEIRRYLIENDWLDAIIQLPTNLFYNTSIATYIWVVSKSKSSCRKGKIQLIDASKMYETRRKAIGNKKVDLTEECRDRIIRAYGEYQNKIYKYGEKIVESKIFNNKEFGFYKIIIETPLKDEYGNIKKKKGKIVPDTDKRDTERVPLEEDIKEYFAREVSPHNNEAWIDEKKTKIGYEIPFTRYFYKYVAPEKVSDIALEIHEIEEELLEEMKLLFGKDGD